MHLFHQMAVVILTTATIAYFSMASDLGSTPVTEEFARGDPGTRQIWVRTTSPRTGTSRRALARTVSCTPQFVRYIQWFITLPLLLLITF